MKHQPTPTTATSSDDFFTPEELVARWKDQITLATLATWRSRETGPKFVKLGGRVVYRKTDVFAYEAKNTRN